MALLFPVANLTESPRAKVICEESGYQIKKGAVSSM